MSMSAHLETAEFRTYLRDNWGRYLLLAGYENISVTPEEVHIIAGKIIKALQPAVYARCHGPVIDEEDYFAVLREMTDEQKKELRGGIPDPMAQ